MNSMEKNSAQKGQALLIILLVMVVGLTIGLSLATRSVSDIKISSQIEQSSRAFSAAEAGIEAALKGETVIDCAAPQTIGQATYCFSTSQAGGTSQPLVFGEIGVADTYNVWLIGHSDTGVPDYVNGLYSGATIDVCWGETGVSPIPAMEIGVVYKNPASEYKIWRGAFDPDNSGRRNNNHFAAPDGGGCAGLAYKKTINFAALGITGTKIALRIRPFYTKTIMGVAPAAGIILPSQGLNIVATGKAGGTTRKVSVIQSFPSLPGIFDYVLFSGTSVTKQ